MFNDEKSYNITLFLKIWAMIFGAMGCIVAFISGFSFNLVYTAIGCLFIALPSFLLISWVGETGGNMLLGLGSKRSKREQLAGELDKARHSLRQENYDEVLAIINAVLELEPDFCEALLLKAECEVREENIHAGKKTLNHLLRVCPGDDTTGSWAGNMLRDLEKDKSKR